MALMALYSSYGSYGSYGSLWLLWLLMAPYGSYGFLWLLWLLWLSWLLWLLWLLLCVRCAFRSRAAPGDGKRAPTRADRSLLRCRNAIWGGVRGWVVSAGGRSNTPRGAKTREVRHFLKKQGFRSRHPHRSAYQSHQLRLSPLQKRRLFNTSRRRGFKRSS